MILTYDVPAGRAGGRLLSAPGATPGVDAVAFGISGPDTQRHGTNAVVVADGNYVLAVDTNGAAWDVAIEQ